MNEDHPRKFGRPFFDQETNYEIILGRPFMCQLMVVQDWGFNCLYLRHDNCVVRFNLEDHSYRDVTKTPVEDFESMMDDQNCSDPNETTSEEGAWLCDLFNKASHLNKMMEANQYVEEQAYKPQPYLEMDIDEFSWMQRGRVCL